MANYIFQNPRKVLAAKEERRNFGRFFFRFPNGEAGLDVYNRATAFLATMSRDIRQYRDSNVSMEHFNVLVITHGLTLRLILMRYFQLTVEEFEESHNAENAKLYIMNRAKSDGDDFASGREFLRLEDASRDALNFKGDLSNEKPVFEREGHDF
jgi:broad specificity phosphatase PhoE